MYLHFYMKSYYEKMLTGWGPYICIPLSIPTIFTLGPGGLEKEKGKNMQETWSEIDTTQGEEGIFVCVRFFPTLPKIRQFWESPCSKTVLWDVLPLWKERRKCNFFSAVPAPKTVLFWMSLFHYFFINSVSVVSGWLSFRSCAIPSVSERKFRCVDCNLKNEK